MQELEKILEEIDQEVKEYMEIDFGDEYNAGIKDMAKMAKKIIRKHMSGKDTDVPTNDGWIPVSIRMPEKAGTYIINVLDGERDIVTFAKWQNRYKRFDMTGARAYWRIIAWRPLPEPYRPEQPETCKYTGGSCCWPIDQCSDCSNHPERGERE